MSEPATSAIGRPPRAVVGIAALWLALLVALSVVVPLYTGPDEHFQFDLVIGVADDHRYFDYDGRNMSQPVLDSAASAGARNLSRHLTADEAVPRAERRRIDEFGPDVASALPNQLPAHPPLFYALTAAGVESARAIGSADGFSFDQLNWLVRLMNVAMVAPLPLLAWWAARRARFHQLAATATAAVPLLVPQIAYVGSTINNDNLLVLVGGLLFVALLPVVVDADLTLRRAVLVGALCGAALFTKGFALAMPLWVAAAYGLAWRRGRAPLGRVAQRLAVSGAIAFVLGGFWWVRNVVLFASPLPAVTPVSVVVDADSQTRLGQWALYLFREIAETGIATFHGLQFAPPMAWMLGAMLVAASVAGWYRWPSRRRELGLAAICVLTVYGSIAFFTLRGHLDNGTLRGFQGRYLFGSSVPLCLLVGVGAVAMASQRWRWAPTIVVVAGLVLQAAAIGTIVEATWGPAGAGPAERYRAIEAWSTLPPPLTALVLVSPLVAAACAVFAVTSQRRAPVQPQFTGMSPSNERSPRGVPGAIGESPGYGGAPEKSTLTRYFVDNSWRPR